MSLPVTIILPVYNAERFLEEALRSILGQTGYEFAVIAVDDGSTDRSFEILRDLADERFTILKRRENHGLVSALNLAISRVATPLAARMDADDIMAPNRLAAQLGFMRENPPVDVCGTYFDYIDASGVSVGGAMQFPVQPAEVVEAFKTFTAIGHPTAMFKVDRIRQTHLYQERFKHAEDYALWLECLSMGMIFANLPQVLLHYRVHKGQVSQQYTEIQRESTRKAREEYGPRIWGGDKTEGS